MTEATAGLVIQPATAAHWLDLESLFGERGACGGCWCMVWRLKRSEFERQKGAENRRALKAIVDSGAEPGLLGYLDSRPVAWCAVAPRERFPALDRSRVLQRVDDQPVWSVTCLFVAPPYRRRGLTIQLLRAAVRHAARHGATIVEGYPVEPRSAHMPAVFAWTGLPSAFRQAGFSEVLRRSPTRPIMRFSVAQNQT
jgi:GNAT superfamily N-acetyltransferase